MTIQSQDTHFGKLIAVIFLVLTNTILFAQEGLITRYEFVGGPGILVNAGSAYADEDRMPKFGYSVGVGAFHSFKPSFELNLRVLWELKGYKASEPYYNPLTSANEVVTIDRNINYLTLSLLPTFLLGPGRKIRLGIGAYYSFLQSAKDNVTHQDQAGQILNQFSGTTTRNAKNDVGLSLSLGYSISISKKNKLLVQLIQNQGVQYFTNSFGYDIRNKVNSLMVSYTIPNY